MDHLRATHFQSPEKPLSRFEVRYDASLNSTSPLPMTDILDSLQLTPEARLLLSGALMGSGIDALQIVTLSQCLAAIDNARRPFPSEARAAAAERQRLDTVVRLICLIGHTYAAALPGHANKEAARLFRDFANGIPVTRAAMDRHLKLSSVHLVESGR